MGSNNQNGRMGLALCLDCIVGGKSVQTAPKPLPNSASTSRVKHPKQGFPATMEPTVTT